MTWRFLACNFQVLVKPLSETEMIIRGTAPIDENTNRVMFEVLLVWF
jgi:hypothetical protein